MKLSGNETAILYHYDLMFKIGKYRLYRVNLKTAERYFLLDHEIKATYKTGFKRIRNSKNKLFVCFGVFK
jgi:hypothetical protein